MGKVGKLAETTVPSLPKLNQTQKEAVAKALANKFSLIQGPPGTGKTITAVWLAYIIAQRNKSRPSQGDIRPQLLICGPSNHSVDVITGNSSSDIFAYFMPTFPHLQ